jgi:hypothetical protein
MDLLLSAGVAEPRCASDPALKFVYFTTTPLTAQSHIVDYSD